MENADNNQVPKKDKSMIYLAIVVLLFLAYFVFFVDKESAEPTESPGAEENSQEQTANTNQDNNQEQMENTNQDNQQVTDLKIEVLQEGSGEQTTKVGDEISVHYTGTLLDGTKFDSSLDRGEPFNFTLGAGQVIAGWDQGLLDMKVGEKRKLTIPASLAYGDRGAGGVIKPGDSLVFETELMAIQ